MESLSMFGGLSGLGVLAAGLGFAYSQFKAGASKAKDDLIDTLRETAVVEREKATRLAGEKETLIRSHQEQINELNKQIGILQGKAEEASKKMAEYLEILKGTSPEQEEFRDYIIKSAKESTKYMKDSSIILKDIKDFMGQMRANGYLVKRIKRPTTKVKP